jgi:hypothetical protein
MATLVRWPLRVWSVAAPGVWAWYRLWRTDVVKSSQSEYVHTRL